MSLFCPLPFRMEEILQYFSIPPVVLAFFNAPRPRPSPALNNTKKKKVQRFVMFHPQNEILTGRVIRRSDSLPNFLSKDKSSTVGLSSHGKHDEFQRGVHHQFQSYFCCRWSWRPEIIPLTLYPVEKPLGLKVSKPRLHQDLTQPSSSFNLSKAPKCRVIKYKGYMTRIIPPK